MRIIYKGVEVHNFVLNYQIINEKKHTHTTQCCIKLGESIALHFLEEKRTRKRER